MAAAFAAMFFRRELAEAEAFLARPAAGAYDCGDDGACGIAACRDPAGLQLLGAIAAEKEREIVERPLCSLELSKYGQSNGLSGFEALVRH
jgi:hypothetical protein